MLDVHVAAGLLLAAALVGSVNPAPAGTLAYWRMEGDGVSTPVAGTPQVLDTNGRTTTNTAPNIVIVDVSGNGNTVWAWDHSGAAHTRPVHCGWLFFTVTNKFDCSSLGRSTDYCPKTDWRKMAVRHFSSERECILSVATRALNKTH